MHVQCSWIMWKAIWPLQETFKLPRYESKWCLIRVGMTQNNNNLYLYRLSLSAKKRVEMTQNKRRNEPKFGLKQLFWRVDLLFDSLYRVKMTPLKVSSCGQKNDSFKGMSHVRTRAVCSIYHSTAFIAVSSFHQFHQYRVYLFAIVQ